MPLGICYERSVFPLLTELLVRPAFPTALAMKDNDRDRISIRNWSKPLGVLLKMLSEKLAFQSQIEMLYPVSGVSHDCDLGEAGIPYSLVIRGSTETRNRKHAIGKYLDQGFGEAGTPSSLDNLKQRQGQVPGGSLNWDIWEVEIAYSFSNQRQGLKCKTQTVSEIVTGQWWLFWLGSERCWHPLQG